MKIKLSKVQWEEIGKNTGWLKTSQQTIFPPDAVINVLKMNPTQAEQIMQLPQVISIITDGHGYSGNVSTEVFISALELNPDQLNQIIAIPEVIQILTEGTQ